MTGKASREQLERLHGLVANALITALQRHQDNPSEELNASLVAQAIKFLKDNDVRCPPHSSNNLGEFLESVHDFPFSSGAKQ